MQDPYTSRDPHSWAVVERQEPVVWGERQGPLSVEERASFARQGFLVREGVFSSDEVEAIRHEAERLARAPADAGIPDKEVISEPDSKEVRSIFRIHCSQPVFARLAREPRLHEVACQLLGGEVYIHQSRINFKPGFDGREFSWHSDFETWHIEDGMPQMRALSVSVMLTENNEFNGPLMLIPGSHRFYVRCQGETPAQHHLQSLKKQEYGTPNRQALSTLIEHGGLASAKGPAGSVVFFDCNTMHASAGNLSPFTRSNIFLVYNSVENALKEPCRGLPPRPDYLAEREPQPLQPLHEA